jgi:hypothetical protein
MPMYIVLKWGNKTGAGISYSNFRPSGYGRNSTNQISDNFKFIIGEKQQEISVFFSLGFKNCGVMLWVWK